MSVAVENEPEAAATDDLSDDRLASEITTLAGHLAAALCRWLLLVAEFDRREAWGAWDCRSCAHWLSWRCGMSLRTAHDHLRVGHALGRLPLVRAHFASGELSYSKVRAITRAAVEPFEEAFFVNFALHATAPMLEAAVSGYRRSGRLDDTAAEDRHRRREFHWWLDDDGMVCFEGRLAPEEAQIVTAAIASATVPAARRSTERPLDDRGEPLPQPGDDPKWARQADALVAVCETALCGGGPAPADEGRGLVADPTATVVVHVDEPVLDHDSDGDCRLEHGPNLSPETARRLACDATTYTIATGPDGRPRLVDLAHKTLNRRLRRLLGERDGGRCRFPGCDLVGRLHAHHIVHREHHGPHTLDNLVTLCAFHHRAVHEGGYRIELLLGQVVVHRPDRDPVTTRPVAAPTGPDIEQRHRLEDRFVHAETIVGRWDGTRLTYDDLSWAIVALNEQRRRDEAAAFN